MDIILFLFILVRNIIPCFFLLEWKEEKKKSIIKASISIIAMLSIYLTSYYILELNSTLLLIFATTMSSMIIFYFFTEYKDARYILTFIMIDTLSAILIFSIDSFVYVTNMNQIVNLVLYLVCFAVGFIYVKKLSAKYHYLMDTIEEGLGVVTSISLVYYVAFYVCSLNPNVLNKKIEYLPIMGVLCILIVLSYIVIFRMLTLKKEVYEIKDKEGDLTSQLRLKENELKLKELYYKMAYEDRLTELKNRTAYEEKLVSIQKKTRRGQHVWYISLDLNDLKMINDGQGHHRGDLLIKSMATSLKIVFTQYGEVFRIGGDEFVVIIEKELNELSLREKLNELDEILNDYGRHTNMDIKSAWGYCLYTASENDTIVEAAVRADDAMYAKKRKMKKNKLIKIESI